MPRLFALLLAAALAVPPAPVRALTEPSLGYTIDLNDRADDLFKVTLTVEGLRPENRIYQFAATAPGTYQVMDIGRFVRRFEALDAAGARVPVTRVAVNQWRLAQPARVRTIRYAIAETWDTKVERNQVYLMCGTSMERDHVLINPHAVIGYPSGLQGAPIRLRLTYPSGWTVGTALERDGDGGYLAESYDHLVDSPILLGRLTDARMMVTGVPVEIYVYSKTDKIKAPQLLSAMDDMLAAAGRFLGRLPVDRYTFLYHFENQTAGAWEHSLSSEYVFQESAFTDSLGRQLTDIAAHEFFHVVTPLNLHSEIVEQFNFVTPVPSQHLWLYEGTTEWAAHIMQLRAGLVSPDEYLARMLQKLRIDRTSFDSSYSLRELALTSYSDSGQAQYANIYMRGALTAGLLDIRLLELSKGERGLREVILELTRKFGKERAFPETGLVDTLVAMTHPEVRDFFARYVWESEPLPIAEYYARLGIRLVKDPDGRPIRFEIDPSPTSEQRLLRDAWLGLQPRKATRTAAFASAPVSRGTAAAADDPGRIEAAVRHYFRAGDENSSAELRRAFHPTAMMFWVAPAGTLAGLSQSDWQRRLDEAGPAKPALARRIEWVDLAGDAAAARLHSEFPTHTFEDYVSLLRVGGRWQIVGKIFHRGQPGAASTAPPETDRRAIDAVLRAKFAAMDANDAAGLGAIYHPRAMSYSVTPAADGGRLMAVSIAEWQARFAERRAAGKPDPAKRSIDRLDIASNAALARLTHDFGTERWVDYVSLLKIGGEWKIIGLLYLRAP